MHSLERKGNVVKAREKSVASLKVQADENVIAVDRWKGCVGAMLCWKKICKTAEKGVSER